MSSGLTTLTIRTSLLICALVASTPAGAATELETFQRRIGKSAGSAVDYPDRAKGSCVCLASLVTGIVFKAGEIRQYAYGTSPAIRVAVECWVPQFSADGSRSGFAACYNFTALPK